MAADGPNADSEDLDLEFDPRLGDLECTDELLEKELTAPDKKLWVSVEYEVQSFCPILSN